MLNTIEDLNEKDINGFTPLMAAAYWGRTDVVKRLLNRGVDELACNKSGDSALLLACEEGHIEIVHLLYNKEHSHLGLVPSTI